ncbi:hypothetical protein [Haladaptatus sp. CMAA 1911]|uniref:hypothetical protein n=1 Tax=unclassified Haladaptatus TaxID=2622732 RepID=UPI003754E7CB
MAHHGQKGLKRWFVQQFFPVPFARTASMGNHLNLSSFLREKLDELIEERE